LVESDKQLRFAIVGSGPAGFYMAKMLLAAVQDCRVDIFDRNPHPYGLIRTGVAPDHQAMKRIVNDFTQVFDQNKHRCKFFGNVWVGDIDQNGADFELARKHERDGNRIQVADLQKRYSAVILAHGAIKDRMLGLDHEDTAQGVLPSRRVVNWYNGSLDDDLDIETEFNLAKSKNITVVGNGNIFCDIARALLKSPKEFEQTDMPMGVIEALKTSQVQNIQAVARRGITQTAFTLKEIREVSAIEGLELYMMKDEVGRSMTKASESELDASTNS